MSKVQVFYESTPNPQSMKFVVDKTICSQVASFESAEDSLLSPLARKIFGFPWAKSVFIGTNFVTITKQDWVDWAILADPLADLLAEHFERGEPILLESSDLKPSDQGTKPQDHASRFVPDPSDSPVVQQIKKILELEIRPAVAMDGGDIQFVKFESGTVYLSMLGACSGCPSSRMTLKEGVESRLQSSISEVKEVVAI